MFSQQDIYRIEKVGFPQSGLLIREIWNDRADKKAFRSYATVHWHYIDSIEYLLLRPDYKAEISCAAHANESYYCDYIGGIGVVVQGVIKLVGESDLGTSTFEKDNKIIKITSAYDRLVFGNGGMAKPYEMVMSEWVPIGIVIDPEARKFHSDEDKVFNKKLERVLNHALKNGIQICQLPSGVVSY